MPESLYEEEFGTKLKTLNLPGREPLVSIGLMYLGAVLSLKNHFAKKESIIAKYRILLLGLL